MDNRHLFSRRKYSNKTNPKERVEAHGFGLTSGRSPRRASASIRLTVTLQTWHTLNTVRRVTVRSGVRDWMDGIAWQASCCCWVLCF